MGKINNTTPETKSRIKTKLPVSLPNSPTSYQYTAAQLKKFMSSAAILDSDNSVFSEINRVVDELNDGIQSGEITSAIFLEDKVIYPSKEELPKNPTDDRSYLYVTPITSSVRDHYRLCYAQWFDNQWTYVENAKMDKKLLILDKRTYIARSNSFLLPLELMTWENCINNLGVVVGDEPGDAADTCKVQALERNLISDRLPFTATGKIDPKTGTMPYCYNPKIVDRFDMSDTKKTGILRVYLKDRLCTVNELDKTNKDNCLTNDLCDFTATYYAKVTLSEDEWKALEDRTFNNVINRIGQTPKGVAPEKTILDFVKNDGIWIAEENGYYYFWNGTQYVKGQPYQGVAINPDDNVFDQYKNALKQIKYNFTQSISPDDFRTDEVNIYGMTYKNLGQGKFSIKGNLEKENGLTVNITKTIPTNIRLIKDHIYYFANNSKGVGTDNFECYINNIYDNGNDESEYAPIFKPDDNGFINYIQVNVSKMGNYDLIVQPILIDLTEMYGIGKEPQNVDELYKLIEKDKYYLNGINLIPYYADKSLEKEVNDFQQSFDDCLVYQSFNSKNLKDELSVPDGIFTKIEGGFKFEGQLPTNTIRILNKAIPLNKAHKYAFTINSKNINYNDCNAQFWVHYMDSNGEIKSEYLTTGDGLFTIFSQFDFPYYEIVDVFLGSSSPKGKIKTTIQPMALDLTEMFGAGNEPTSREELYKQVAKYKYYPFGKTLDLSLKYVLKDGATDNTGVLALNPPETVGQRVIQASFGNTLNLACITDNHGSVPSIKRFTEFCNAYDGYINDRLSMGDTVAHLFSDDYTYWLNNGGDEILMAIGNHDAWYSIDPNIPSFGLVPRTDVYNKFIAPNVTKWKVTQPDNAATLGLNYYYKDYSKQKIRLIVLDCMYYDDTQSQWFTNVLEDARTKGLTVVASQHYPLHSTIEIDTGFCEYGGLHDLWGGVGADNVDTFITNGGKFACWITGHTHYDNVGIYEAPSGNQQLTLVFDCSRVIDEDSQNARKMDTKSQDSFNIVSIDADNSLVKIVRVGCDMDKAMRSKQYFCYDYKSKKLVSTN